MPVSAGQLVETYQMVPHPEGGFYKETYRAGEVIQEECLPIRFRGERVFSTAIYFLLEGEQFSAFHKIMSDEVWHFYAGGALNIYVIDPAGNFELLTLGSNLSNGEVFQAVVKAGHWFASQPVEKDKFSFVGCTVAPGFDFEDFLLAGKEEMVQLFPQHESLITRFCR